MLEIDLAFDSFLWRISNDAISTIRFTDFERFWFAGLSKEERSCADDDFVHIERLPIAAVENEVGVVASLEHTNNLN